jgi:hypothetical protein
MMNTQRPYNTVQLSGDELRQRLENSRQPTLKSKLEERRQAEALQRMITQLRTSAAA